MIDGQALGNLAQYLVEPIKFSYDVPSGDNIYHALGVEVSGKVDPSFVTGYWVMLPPFAPGTHTVKFSGTTKTEPEDNHVEMDYKLEIAP